MGVVRDKAARADVMAAAGAGSERAERDGWRGLMQVGEVFWRHVGVEMWRNGVGLGLDWAGRGGHRGGFVKKQRGGRMRGQWVGKWGRNLAARRRWSNGLTWLAIGVGGYRYRQASGGYYLHDMT